MTMRGKKLSAITFKDKIDKIIDTNPYMIGSVTALEQSCGLSMSALKRYYNDDKEPSITLVKRILHALHIPKSWWDNPIGNPFVDPFEVYKDFSSRIEKLEFQNEVFRKEVAELRIANALLKESIAKIQKKYSRNF